MNKTALLNRHNHIVVYNGGGYCFSQMKLQR